MIGYKALNKDFTAFNNFKYEIGKIYELDKDEKLEICKCGFHFCKNPIDVFAYYADSDDIIIVKVEALGEIVHQGTKYATDKIKIIKEYSKEELYRSMIYNNNNTGKCNTGDYNSGIYNSGNYNTGEYNSGNYNSGKGNSGSWNSGDYNIGKCNTGDYNDGNYNTGDYNNGNYNTGDYNSGNGNSGIFNDGNGNIGIFNTDEPPMRAFNKETTMTLRSFIDSLDYSFGTLCERIYNKNLIKGDREKIEALPNYDPDIFTEITGINFDCDKDDLDEEMKERAISDLEFKVKYLSKEIDALNEIITKLKTKSN